MTLPELTELSANGVRFIGAASGGSGRNILGADLENAVVAIGNEGRGLSPDVLSLCGETITIPTVPECESLNAAAAAAVIMWEARRRQV